MRCHAFFSSALVGLVGLAACATVHAAGSPTAEQALRLSPIQKDVDYDRPAAPAECTIKAEKTGGRTGWVVRDAKGQILRLFLDSNGNNVVDTWCYFKEGLEVYRDVDSNHNGKADQYRWLNTAGTRWGLDRNEDGTIDSWKSISAEEVTAEVVAALRERSEQRFAVVLLTPQELDELGPSPAKREELVKKLEAAPAAFREAARKQKTVDSETRWASFGGSRPGVVPAGPSQWTQDLLIYDNAAAMVDSGAKHNQVPIGTLIHIGNGWRVIDAPQLSSENNGELVAQSYFFDSPLAGKDEQETSRGGGSTKSQGLMTELGKLDQEVPANPAAQAKLNNRRADILRQLADEATDPTERASWVRQLADTLASAVQAGSYAEGVERLKSLYESLNEKRESDLAGYVEFRYMAAEYGQSLAKPDTDYAKVQAAWIERLEKYIAAHPRNPDAADAMFQLATARELAGEEEKAQRWYESIVRDFRSSTHYAKAQGAKARLASVGRNIDLRGRSIGGKAVDLNAAPFKGKVVLIQYWATWSEPCLEAIPQIKEMLAKYGKSGFAVIGVSFDNSPKVLRDYLEANSVPWPHIYEPGGMENRLANELGILTVPTMILVDRQGRVVNRSIHARELDGELKQLLKPRVASRVIE